MGAEKVAAPLRVVLDTNVVLSALLFEHGRLAWLRGTWQSSRVVPLVCRESAGELLRALSYPKFKLTAQEQEELLADFLPYAETVALPDKWPRLPRCRDPHDRVFLALARCADAEALVTGDKDLLALASRFTPPILTAEALRARLHAP